MPISIHTLEAEGLMVTHSERRRYNIFEGHENILCLDPI